MSKNSNTTLVKVKYENWIRTGEEPDSNTTLVKVKFRIFHFQIFLVPIQIQHLLKLNELIAFLQNPANVFKYNTC